MTDEEEAKLQQLIAEKLAEIDLELQIPVQFVSFAGGPKAVQMAAVIKSMSAIQSASDTDAMFAEMAKFEQERDRKLRAVLVEKQRLYAMVDLEQMTQDAADAKLAQSLQAEDLAMDDLLDYERRLEEQRSNPEQ